MYTINSISGAKADLLPRELDPRFIEAGGLGSGRHKGTDDKIASSESSRANIMTANIPSGKIDPAKEEAAATAHEYAAKMQQKAAQHYNSGDPKAEDYQEKATYHTQQANRHWQRFHSAFPKAFIGLMPN